jgi:hypothetical protein
MDEHLLVTHSDMCETCMLQWGSASSLSQNHLKLFGQHTVPKGGAPAKFQIFKQGYKFFTFILY